MRRALLLVVAVCLIAPVSAWAGGFATAGLSSTPAGVDAGEKWDVNITILQHGRTPMSGLTPAVVIDLPGGDEQRFTGAPTGKPGVYRASVVFPEAGTYTYRVDDGFTNAFPHTFPPVQIGDGASAPATSTATAADGIPWWPFMAAAGVVALLALSLSGLARARRRAASSAAPRSARAAVPGPNG
jgi:hypothetical protein